MKLSDYSKKTFAALENDNKTVQKVYKNIIDKAEKRIMNNQKVNYVGVKNTDVIPYDLVIKIENQGYLHHTDDTMSKGGRAIDIKLINPITGRWMTGSSSGSALNVFYDINDVAIATDGGGSVLAPAISLNLIGFISPLIYQKEMKKHRKQSTDDIIFSPSIGFISKDINLIKELTFLSIKEETPQDKKLNTLISKPNFKVYDDLYNKIKTLGKEVTISYNNFARKTLMQDLREIDFENNILITYEGPVDLNAYGDSVMGHYSEESKRKQQQANKYYLTVVNMLNLSSIIIPSKKHGTGILLTCKSEVSAIKQMIDLAKTLIVERSNLEKRYFSIY